MSENPYETPANYQPEPEEFPQGSGYSIYGPVRSLTALASFSKLMLIMNIVYVVGVEAYNYSDFYNENLDNDLMWQEGGAIDQIEYSLDLISYVILIFSALTICMWTSKAMANTWAIAKQRPTITPGWAAGWHFIPIASLWKPYQAMAEIWDGAFEGRTSKVIPLTWWVCWVISGILDLIASMERGDVDFTYLYLVSSVFTVFSALLLITTIDRITKYHHSILSNDVI